MVMKTTEIIMSNLGEVHVDCKLEEQQIDGTFFLDKTLNILGYL